MSSFASLTTALTTDQVETAIYDFLAAAGVSTTSWKTGAVVRVIVSAVASVGAAFSELQALIAKNGFLDESEGEWLEALALFVYDVEKSDGTFAVGEVLLDNTAGAGVYSGGIGDLIVTDSGIEKSYRNTESFSVGAGGTDTVAIEAIEIGTASNSNPGGIDTLTTPLPGVVVSNAAAVVGSDEDTDPELRELCRLKLGSLSPNGAADAYRFVAFSAVDSDDVSIGVNRIAVIPDGVGGVDVYVADTSGTLSGSVGDTSTSLGKVDDDIQTQVVPEAITATVQAATPKSIAVTYTLWIEDTLGLSTSQVEALIAAELATYINNQPVGGDIISPASGFIYGPAIEAAITSTVLTGSTLVSDVLINFDLVVPGGDTAITTVEAPILGTVTPTTNLVSV